MLRVPFRLLGHQLNEAGTFWDQSSMLKFSNFTLFLNTLFCSRNKLDFLYVKCVVNDAKQASRQNLKNLYYFLSPVTIVLMHFLSNWRLIFRYKYYITYLSRTFTCTRYSTPLIKTIYCCSSLIHQLNQEL